MVRVGLAKVFENCRISLAEWRDRQVPNFSSQDALPFMLRVTKVNTNCGTNCSILDRVVKEA